MCLHCVCCLECYRIIIVGTFSPCVQVSVMQQADDRDLLMILPASSPDDWFEDNRWSLSVPSTRWTRTGWFPFLNPLVILSVESLGWEVASSLSSRLSLQSPTTYIIWGFQLLLHRMDTWRLDSSGMCSLLNMSRNVKVWGRPSFNWRRQQGSLTGWNHRLSRSLGFYIFYFFPSHQLRITKQKDLLDFPLF